MHIVITGLAAPVALACVALIGYLVGRRQRQQRANRLLELTRKLDETHVLITRVQKLSDQLRCSMASHHGTVTRCQEQIQILSQQHSGDADAAHHMHLLEVLGPTRRLSDDIAHAYDELRQHTSALRHLRER